MPRRPRGPNADSEQWIRRGLRARASSAPAPRRSAALRKLCTRTSAPSMSAPSASRPSAVRRSRTIPGLSRLAAAELAALAVDVVERAPLVPGQRLDLHDVGPGCPSVMVAGGPPRWWVRSTTRIPASGPGAGMGSDTADLRGDGAVTLSSSPPPANPSSPRRVTPPSRPARPSCHPPGCARCAARNASTARLTATGASPERVGPWPDDGHARRAPRAAAQVLGQQVVVSVSRHTHDQGREVDAADEAVEAGCLPPRRVSMTRLGPARR